MTVRRPAVRWHGGKWLLAPWIHGFFPPHRTYVEPFGGGGSVLLRKPRSYAEIYNDLDTDVVNLFRVLRSDDAHALQERLRLTPFSRDEFNDAYQDTDCPIERARRLVIRSFMGFGSNGHSRVTGFRANSNRSGTTPAHDWANYAEAMSGLILRLAGVVIENKDARDVIRQHDSPETLFYVDPPYVHSSRSDLGNDYAHELTDDDHRELGEVLQSVSGMVVLSGYHSELYDQMFGWWEKHERASLADGARPRTEVVWLNDNARKRLNETSAQLELLA